MTKILAPTQLINKEKPARASQSVRRTFSFSKETLYGGLHLLEPRIDKLQANMDGYLLP